MSCNVTKGRSRVCRNKVGGLKAIYLGNGSDFATGVAYSGNNVSTLPTANVYKYDLEGQHGQGSYTSEAQISPDNHTVFFQPTVMAMLPHMTAEDQRELTAMIQSNSLFVFAEDNNGNVWMVEDAQVSANTTASGQAFGDFNGYTVSFQANMKYKPYRLLSGATPFAAYAGITVIDGSNNS